MEFLNNSANKAKIGVTVFVTNNVPYTEKIITDSHLFRNGNF